MADSFPPHNHHATKRISSSEALTLLSDYLHQAITDPSLHPNALLTENGPIAPSTGSATGLILHNLERLEAGLRGEHLAAEELSFIQTAVDGETKLTGLAHDPTFGAVRDRIDEEGERVMEMDWQDRGEFEREQDIVQGEVGPRSNVFMDGGPLVEGETAVIRDQAKQQEARKKARKERRKQLLEIEEQRKRENDAKR